MYMETAEGTEMTMTNANQKVVTWTSASNAEIHLTPEQEQYLRSVGRWPKDARGQEYCRVSHGLHRDTPTWTDAELRAEFPAR